MSSTQGTTIAAPALEPRKAAAPFDGDDTDADVVLRSSDQVDFRVHKIILSLASPLFKDMFRVPQPPAGSTPSTDPAISSDGLPIVNVTEDAHTLEFVLRSCYPVRSPTFSKLSEVRLVLEASTKYEIDAVQAVAEAGLKAVVEEDPLGVFAIACRCNRDDICRLAAKHLVHHSLTSLESEELHTISAFTYHKLTKWHRLCCIAAAGVVSSREWFLACDQVLQNSEHKCTNCFKQDPLPSTCRKCTGHAQYLEEAIFEVWW
ncbi:hypothetical protein DENSPDRAFT_844135 [Dentipellis sp. KUC8613]|nr:hypothetical protein DENSPDRAFT_844135 [Dentipellis sp. KUC8613]